MVTTGNKTPSTPLQRILGHDYVDTYKSTRLILFFFIFICRFFVRRQKEVGPVKRRVDKNSSIEELNKMTKLLKRYQILAARRGKKLKICNVNVLGS